MLREDEAVEFLKDVLGITNATTEYKENRIQLLNKVICQFHKIPFQSLSLMADPVKKRHRPDLKHIKKACQTKEGGLCYTLNIFLYFLLQALGYDVYLNMSHVVTGCVNNHVFVVLKNLINKGDTYLVEGGCGYPTFQAVGLDFIRETPLMQSANLEYKFDRAGNTIRRLHKQVEQDKFEVFYEFELNPTRDLESIYKHFDYIFENEDALRFHHTFVVKKFENGKVFLIRNETLTLVTENGETTRVEMRDKVSVFKNVNKYFPEIREDTLENAYNHWCLSKST